MLPPAKTRRSIRPRESGTHPPRVARTPILSTGARWRRLSAPLLAFFILLPLGCSATKSDEPATTAQVSATATSGAKAPDSLDRSITQTMDDYSIPGLAAVVIRDNRVVLARGYGFADIDHHVPVTPDTDFLISSCSKPIGAATLMQLYDQRRFGLDDDINRYLPFNARNPRYPNSPITFRQLLTHTSSLAGDWVDADGNWSTSRLPISSAPISRLARPTTAPQISSTRLRGPITSTAISALLSGHTWPRSFRGSPSIVSASKM
jgi:CubicO group peptidase (beta-lactamase class C family)